MEPVQQIVCGYRGFLFEPLQHGSVWSEWYIAIKIDAHQLRDAQTAGHNADETVDWSTPMEDCAVLHQRDWTQFNKLVGGLVAIFCIFPLILGFDNHPNWRTHIFSEGWPNHQPDEYSTAYQIDKRRATCPGVKITDKIFGCFASPRTTHWRWRWWRWYVTPAVGRLICWEASSRISPWDQKTKGWVSAQDWPRMEPNSRFSSKIQRIWPPENGNQ